MHHDIGSRKSRSCTSNRTPSHIYCVFILKRWKPYWRNFTMECAVATLEENLYRIGLSLNVTGGPTCKSPLKIISRSVINPKVCPKYSSTRGDPKPFFQSMAFCTVRLGYSWIFPKGNWKPKMAPHQNWLLHKVGRDQTSLQHPSSGREEVHLEKYRHKVWSSAYTSLR